MASDPGTLGCEGLQGPDTLSTAIERMYRQASVPADAMLHRYL